MKQTDFARTLTRFLSEYLPGQRGMAANTIKSYRDAFKQLILFCDLKLNTKAEHITFDKLKAQRVRDFLTWLEKERSVCINTRNQRLAAIHSFYRYAQSECPDILLECQRILGIEFKKRGKKTINYLPQECLECILKEPDTATKKGRRDLVMVATLYDSGARVKELIDLKAGDIRLDSPATITLKGKADKQRQVPIMGKTRDLLADYMKENYLLENRNQGHPLFYNSRKHPFTRPGITYILKKYLKLAKKSHPEVLFPETLHPHMLRHLKALCLLDAGVNLVYIRDLLGM